MPGGPWFFWIAKAILKTQCSHQWLVKSELLIKISNANKNIGKANKYKNSVEGLTGTLDYYKKRALQQHISPLERHEILNIRIPEIETKLARKKNPKRKKKTISKRKKNPPLIQPFKVVIGAIARRGHKTMMWFDGKHFRTTKVKRAMFSSIHLAKVMALSLIKRFPVLSKYTVGIYKA